MGLPIRTTREDIESVTQYLARKPTGVIIDEARRILDSKFLDGRKISALRFWGIVESNEEQRLKLTEIGRDIAKGGNAAEKAYRKIIHDVPPYQAIAEKLFNKNESIVTATDVGIFWHEHYRGESGDSDKILNDQAVCLFQLLQCASLGSLVIGRKGSPTRFEFGTGALASLFESNSQHESSPSIDLHNPEIASKNEPPRREKPHEVVKADEQKAIFVAHGKNRKPLDQLEKILNQFKIPFKIAIEEPNLGRPIGSKVRDTMQQCNCAILIFTCDEEFFDESGNRIWRPSENVIYELGAASYLYGNRVVVIKEEEVVFPSNFRDIGYISFTKDHLDAKSMAIIQELLGFGILKLTV